MLRLNFKPQTRNECASQGDQAVSRWRFFPTTQTIGGGGGGDRQTRA
jgi:hypothetical protein